MANICILNTSKQNEIIKIVIVTCYKINTNAYAMIEFQLITNKTSHFYPNTIIINIIYTIVYTIEASVVICAIKDKASSFIIIDGTAQQTLNRKVLIVLNCDIWDHNRRKIAQCYPINNKYNYLILTITTISVIMTETITFQTKKSQLLLIKHISDSTIVSKQACNKDQTEIGQECNRSKTNTQQYTTTNINEMTSAVDILIEISILAAFSYVLTIVFDRIALNLGKQHEFECDYANNGDVTLIMNDFYKTRATSIVFGFFWDVFCFILQALDTSPSNITLSIEFEAVVITIDGLLLIFAVSLHTQVVHKVCAVFFHLFSFVCIIFDLMSNVLLISTV